jgi:hypothetical protein
MRRHKSVECQQMKGVCAVYSDQNGLDFCLISLNVKTMLLNGQKQGIRKMWKDHAYEISEDGQEWHGDLNLYGGK